MGHSLGIVILALATPFRVVMNAYVTQTGMETTAPDSLANVIPNVTYASDQELTNVWNVARMLEEMHKENVSATQDMA